MDNRHLFELMNAAPGLADWHLGIGLFLAEWIVGAVALAFAWLLARSDRAGRVELLQALAAMAIALLIAQAVERLWPQPRPFALHLGTQYLAHAADAGLPSEPTTALWTLALSALRSRRFGPLAFPLLTIGLLVGCSRVYLGIHFPYDIAAALPVAAAGVGAARCANAALAPAALRVALLCERLEARILAAVSGRRRGGGRR